MVSSFKVTKFKVIDVKKTKRKILIISINFKIKNYLKRNKLLWSAIDKK